MVFKFHKLYRTISMILIYSMFFSMPINAKNYAKEAQERKSLPIESNLLENWPLGPAIGAQAAILMDAYTGSILYAKNIHEKLYPASITKLLTSYIALQECDLDEKVIFSDKAVNSIKWWEDANMGVNAGTYLTMEEVLYGILVGSANEAAYAVAEHISGEVESFSLLMNKTAKELGCTNSNFITPNGIHNENHYTTAYDIALIAKAFFSNNTLIRMSSTTSFTVPVNESQKREDIILNAKSLLLPGKTYAYESLIGTKTGYTEYARQTLVSCAEKNGMKLICVILKEEAPAQYTDTIELFNYGFENFKSLSLADIKNEYSVDNHFFTSDIDLLGSSKTILSFNKDDYIILPNTISYSDLTSKVLYDKKIINSIASIHYYYKNNFLGRINVELAKNEPLLYDFSNQELNTLKIIESDSENTIFINISHILLGLFFIIIFITFLFSLCSLLKNNIIFRKHKKKFKKRDNIRNRRHIPRL